MTQDELKSRLNYNPDTGIFTWLPGPSAKRAGQIAGCIMINRRNNHIEQRYIYINWYSKKYRAHRLAWLYMTGVFPVNVDHINHNGLDNRWSNLREATPSQNCQNRKPYTTRGLLKGVSKANNGKFIAYINIEGRRTHLGYYDTAEEAKSVYDNKALEIYGEFACL